MKTINVKLFAIIYTLNKHLTKKLDEMKKAIAEGANLTFKDYADIKIVECTRKSYTKEQQEAIDEFARKQGFEKQEVKYTRIEIDHINSTVAETVEKVINELEDSNDKIIKKVASKVANKK